MLFHMEKFGNAASVEDIAHQAGCLVESVENYMQYCFKVIEHHHDTFVHFLMPEKKEHEKKWADQQVGFRGHWQNR